MLLVIDVGNTHTVLGLFDNSTLKNEWRIRTVKEITSDEFNVLVNALFTQNNIDYKDVKKTIISSVVSEVINVLNSFCSKYLDHPPVWINADSVKSLIPIRYDNPDKLGPDRIVNAIAAYEKHKCALVIIDFGTATTFDAVSAKGEFLGGAIAPGVAIASEALANKTSQLPKIDFSSSPENVIGENTIDSIKSGVIHGNASMVDGMVAKMIKEMGEPVKILATGGLAPTISGISNTIDLIEKNLTLEGLKIIADKL